MNDQKRNSIPLTDNEKLVQRIKSLPIDPEYKPTNNIPIPLGKGVLVKKVKASVITNNGIIIDEGSNTPKPHMGIIYAIGPNCSEFLRVGLRCYFNFFVDSSFYIDGVDYYKMDENDVFYLIPPNTVLFETPLTEKAVRREKKLDNEQATLKRIYNKNQEDKDKKDFEKTRGKNFIISKK